MHTWTFTNHFLRSPCLRYRGMQEFRRIFLFLDFRLIITDFNLLLKLGSATRYTFPFFERQRTDLKWSYMNGLISTCCYQFLLLNQRSLNLLLLVYESLHFEELFFQVLLAKRFLNLVFAAIIVRL